jgi:hypothetical protein
MAYRFSRESVIGALQIGFILVGAPDFGFEGVQLFHKTLRSFTQEATGILGSRQSLSTKTGCLLVMLVL